MAEFKITKFMPRLEGIASTLNDADIREPYVNAVEKLVIDNSFMGEIWQNKVLDLLLTPFKTPNIKGDLRGSNPYMNIFIAQLGIPLISLKKLRQSYEQNKNKSPFPSNYIDIGLALIPGKKEEYRNNSDLAKGLVYDLNSRGIPTDKANILDFTQLRLIIDKETGLAFKLNESSVQKDQSDMKNYNWDYVGENGLFRAYLGNSSKWFANNGNMEYSEEDGRAIRYDIV